MRTTRREFLKAVAAGAAAGAVGPGAGRLLGAAAEAGGGAEAAKALRPNIIFIVADDLGYGDIGCFGQKKIRTPNVDRIAAEGIRFTDFYSGGALSIPSRSCLMTGLHTGHTRHGGSNAHKPLEDEDVTVAEVLRAAGYCTGMMGKWALGDDETGPGAPHKQGWDYYYGEPNQTKVHSYWLPHVWEFDRDGTVSGLPADKEMRQIPLPGNAGGKKTDYSHDLLAKAILRFLDVKAKAKDGRPFLLYVPFTIPHSDLDVPDDAPYTGESWPQPEKNYAAMITRMDADIGRILDSLKRHGIEENTLVIFTSDNGPTNGKGHTVEFFDSNGPLKGAKGGANEGGIRVPTAARWVGKVRPGSTCAEPLAFWDFLPTAAELAGAKAPEGLDGISFVPALLGRPQKPHEYLYWQTQKDQAVRIGHWKALGAKGKVTALYDLQTDLGEQSNIAAAHPDVVKKAERFLQAATQPRG